MWLGQFYVLLSTPGTATFHTVLPLFVACSISRWRQLWQYADDTLLVAPQVRDDNKRQHPCLVDFAKLPETERNYNLQMSSETLK